MAAPAAAHCHCWIHSSTAPPPPGNLFPFIEERQATVDTVVNSDGGEVLEFDTRIHQVPIELMNCPTRRRAQPYPIPKFVVVDLAGASTAIRCDYAANAGELDGASATT